MFMWAISRGSRAPFWSTPALYPVLFLWALLLCYQLLTWYELTPEGITRRRLIFFTTAFAWSDLHKFTVIRWKGTTDFLLFFNGFKKKISIPSTSINIIQLRHFITTYTNNQSLLYNGQAKDWLYRPSA